MYKVFAYCLDIVFIIDTTKNTTHTTHAWYIAENDFASLEKNKQHITKVVINKYLKNYQTADVNNRYVVGAPLLSIYAPEQVNDWDKTNGVIKNFIAEFETLDDMSKFFAKVWETAKPYVKIARSCNEWSDIIEGLVKVKRGLTKWEITAFYNKTYSQDEKVWEEYYKASRRMFELMPKVA